MRRAHLALLVCPECEGSLALTPEQPEVESGLLTCTLCPLSAPVEGGVPRFLGAGGYASSFGYQWLTHAKTQLDSNTGTTHSEDRFFAETRWPRDLAGEVVLEVGGGAGRFTEQALKTGATVVSVDASRAVEANWEANGANPNVLVIQADLFRLPLRARSFDRVFCFGVLQHTPDPEGAFRKLAQYPKRRGHLAIDVYEAPTNLRNRLFATKYWARRVTRHVPAAVLYPVCRRYVSAMWPLSGVINRLAGNWVNWLLLVQDYRGIYDLPEPLLREWAILDTFDALSPRYDAPQTVETVRRWFADAGLARVDVHPGYNGIEGRGLIP